MRRTDGRRSGAAALVEALAKAGVETVFGYPGNNVLAVFDALREAPFGFVLGRHEQGCVHMADGYARASGRVGVCIVTSGPGATNAVTGLATANIDGVPLVVITGQVPLGLVGTDAFQEADTSGITRGVTKHNFLVRSADEIPETVAQAFYIATHGKPGVVAIDVPRDCQEALTAVPYPERVSLRAYHPERAATSSELNRFAKLLNAATRPVLYAGGGVIASGASADVAALAHKAGIPVATTLMGLGSFDPRDSLSLGLAGLHGTATANRAIAACDLLVALGVRFSDRVTGQTSRYAKRAKIVHVDCDPSSIGKNVRAALGIVADVKDVLTTVDARVKPSSREAWRGQVAQWRASEKIRLFPSRVGSIAPERALDALAASVGREAIIVTDVGQHQMWAAQRLVPARPRRFLTSGGMGTMGFGIPAAIGAALARPDLRVVAVLGDGGAQMTFEELVVATERRLRILFVIFNNGCLGMVRQWQDALYGRRSMSALGMGGARYLPDFVRLAEAHGAKAWRVEDPAKLEAALARAARVRGPAVLEIMIDPEANVSPVNAPSELHLARRRGVLV